MEGLFPESGSTCILTVSPIVFMSFTGFFEIPSSLFNRKMNAPLPVYSLLRLDGST